MSWRGVDNSSAVRLDGLMNKASKEEWTTHSIIIGYEILLMIILVLTDL